MKFFKFKKNSKIRFFGFILILFVVPVIVGVYFSNKEIYDYPYYIQGPGGPIGISSPAPSDSTSILTAKNRTSKQREATKFQTITPKPTPIPTPQVFEKKPSEYANFLANFIVMNTTPQEHEQLIELFALGTNNLAIAKDNFARELDRNSDALIRAEYLFSQLLSRNMNRGGGSSSLEDRLEEINNKLDDLETRDRWECYDRGGTYFPITGCR